MGSLKFSLFSEDTINKLLKQYIENGQWSKAQEQCAKLVNLHPEDVTLRLKLADICLKSNKKEDALKQYQIVTENYIHLGNLPRAITILRTLLTLDPSLCHVRVRLAEIYEGTGEIMEAWGQYSLAFKYLEDNKMIPQAIGILDRMVKLKLIESTPLIKMAELLASKELTAQAATFFLGAAECYLEQQNLEKVKETYQRALIMDPGSREARLGLEGKSSMNLKQNRPVSEYRQYKFDGLVKSCHSHD